MSTTFIAGVEAIKKGIADRSARSLRWGRFGWEANRQSRPAGQRLRTASLAWRPGLWRVGHLRRSRLRSGDACGRTRARSGHSAQAGASAVEPMKAVFDQRYVKRLNGTHVKKGANKMELAQQLMEDIESFKRTQVRRVVMIWCASTEVFMQTGEEPRRHQVVRTRDASRTTKRLRPR